MRFLADENFNNDIVTGLLQKRPHLDIVRVQDGGLSQQEDPVILIIDHSLDDEWEGQVRYLPLRGKDLECQKH